MKQWYVIHTRARAEMQAMTNLIRQGFSAYLPRYIKTRRHARVIERVVAPLFPRYLFVEMDPSRDRWRCLNSTFGVHQLISQGDCPTPIPDSVVDEIRGREDDRGLVRLGSSSGLRPGDRVRVLDGAFTDFVGLFDSISDEERVVILLDLLGRQVKVRLPSYVLSAER